DKSEEKAKQILETASVAGREFSRSLLQKLTTDEAGLLRSLELLKELGLIQQVSVLPEAVYKFRHPLIQETAYQGLLAHERKGLHGAVGESLEALYPDRLEEHFDALAHHFSVAEKWDKSVHYGRAAAKKAMELGDFAVALTQLERVEDWLNKLPQKADIQNIMVDLLLEQERLCETLGDREQQEALLARALSTLHGTKDRHLMSE